MKTATTRKPKPTTSAEPPFRVVRAPESEPAPAGVKKLNLGALTKAPSGKSSKVHPQIVISDETRALLQQFLEVEPQFKTLEKQSKSLKEQLGPAIKADLFAHLHGTAIDGHSFTAQGVAGVRLVVKDSYTKTLTDDRAIITALAMNGMPMNQAAAFVGRHFRQATKLEIDLDKVAEDKQQAFADAIISAAEQLGITDGVSAKQYIAPRAGFHTARTTLLTAELNNAIDSALPVSAFAQLEK